MKSHQQQKCFTNWIPITLKLSKHSHVIYGRATIHLICRMIRKMSRKKDLTPPLPKNKMQIICSYNGIIIKPWHHYYKTMSLILFNNSEQWQKNNTNTNHLVCTSSFTVIIFTVAINPQGGPGKDFGKRGMVGGVMHILAHWLMVIQLWCGDWIKLCNISSWQGRVS